MTEIEKRNKVCAQARAWLGRKEADGSHKEIIDLYNKNRLPGTYAMSYADPWCAAFVSAVGMACGLRNVVLPHVNCDGMIASYKLAGCWVEDDAYIDHCLEITAYARSKGLHVNFSPYDTTRCNIPFLLKVMQKLHDSGNVDRIRLVDTVGSATPQAMTYYVKILKDVLQDIPLEVHVHNDFGMAMANSMAALCAGAEVVSTTMNGVGERSGNTPTEEVVLTLQLLYGIDLGVDCSVLKETSELVQRLSGVKLARNKAVVGQNCFAHESGLAVAGMKNMPYTSEAYNPALVGQARRIVLGKKSGKSSIEQVLTKMGFEGFTPEDIAALLSQVKDVSIANKRAVEEDEFVAMAKARLEK